MVQLVHELKTRFEDPALEETVFLEMVNLINAVLTNSIKLDPPPKKDIMPTLFVFFLKLVKHIQTESHLRVLLQGFQTFLDLDVTSSVSRAALLGKIDRKSKISKYLLRKLRFAETYLTQEKLVGLWTRILKETNFWDSVDSVEFHPNERYDMIFKRDFNKIKTGDFVQVILIHLGEDEIIKFILPDLSSFPEYLQQSSHKFFHSFLDPRQIEVSEFCSSHRRSFG
jgi:hypothetical protein